MPATFGEVRSLASDILGRTKLAMAAGITFAGLRDLWRALGYKRELTTGDYRARFERNEIAYRIVTAFPRATWKGSGELIEDETTMDSTEFEAAWFELTYRLKIWPLFRRADVLAGLGDYATILIGAAGKLNEELPQMNGPQDILYLQPYAQDDLKVDKLETDPLSERFGEPLTYKLKRGRLKDVKVIGQTNNQTDSEVHWTRVIHVSDGLLDDNLNGTPRLRSTWNRIDDLEKVVGSGSEAFWLRAHQGYHFDLDKEVDTALLEDKEKMGEEAEKFAHGLSRIFRSKGMKVKALGSDVANFKGNVESLLSLISAGCEIPQRILLGSERGELASTQDRDNWSERVNDRRSEYAEPYVVRQLIDRFIHYGAMPEPMEYEVRWPSHEPSDMEKAELSDKIAGANQKQGSQIVTTNEMRDKIWGLPPLEEMEVEEEGNVEEIDEGESQEDDEEDERVVAAARNAAKRRRRIQGTVLDKRRHWWRSRQKSPRQPFSTTNVVKREPEVTTAA
jgi:uncharacterized protein